VNKPLQQPFSLCIITDTYSVTADIQATNNEQLPLTAEQKTTTRNQRLLFTRTTFPELGRVTNAETQLCLYTYVLTVTLPRQ